MVHISWRDEYSINVVQIDIEHQNMARLVNELNEAVELNMEMQVLGEKLAEIIEHTRAHFDTEEDLMRTYAYPHYFEHKVEHDTLMSYLRNAEDRLSRGGKLTFPVNFDVSCDLFVTHLNECDRALGGFLNELEIY